MAPRPLLLLLLLLLLGGSAARSAPRRARRHSDGTFTSELSRLREAAQLQRLLQSLVGKRSAQDAGNGTGRVPGAERRLCLLWSDVPVLRARMPLRTLPDLAWSISLPPEPTSEVTVSDPASTTAQGSRGAR